MSRSAIASTASVLCWMRTSLARGCWWSRRLLASTSEVPYRSNEHLKEGMSIVDTPPASVPSSRKAAEVADR